MNFKKIILPLAVLAVIFSGCKKEGVPDLTHLTITSISPVSPRVDSVFTVTVEARDKNGGNQVLDANTTVTLSLVSGTGHLTGDLTATMEAPANIVKFTNVKYDVVESDVVIRATVSGGTSLADGLSAPFNVTGPMLIFKFKFDSTQVRLDAFGNPSTMPVGHAGQSPKFNSMSAHYIEFAPNDITPLGGGTVLYRAAETTAGGPSAIDFDQSVKAGEGQTFFSMPLKTVAQGTYKWLRISLAYQNYDIKFRYLTYDLTGTLASFIGFNTYINSYKIKNSTVAVGANKLQGYWGFETNSSVTEGQASVTTVPNPNPSSPIPAGSCVVTAQFTPLLNIPTNATHDMVITVSLSTNKSFEWMDLNSNGIYEPAAGDVVVDMGIRGMIPIVQY